MFVKKTEQNRVGADHIRCKKRRVSRVCVRTEGVRVIFQEIYCVKKSPTGQHYILQLFSLNCLCRHSMQDIPCHVATHKSQSPPIFEHLSNGDQEYEPIWRLNATADGSKPHHHRWYTNSTLTLPTLCISRAIKLLHGSCVFIAFSPAALWLLMVIVGVH